MVNVSGLARNMGESVIYVRTHGILGRLCNSWDTSWDTWENLILMGEIMGYLRESVIDGRNHGILGRICNRWEKSWDTWENL